MQHVMTLGAIQLTPPQQSEHDAIVRDLQTTALPPSRVMPTVRQYAKLLVASGAYALPLQLDRDIADFSNSFEDWLYTGTWSNATLWDPQLGQLLARVEAAGTAPKQYQAPSPVLPPQVMPEQIIEARSPIYWWPIPVIAVGLGLYWANKEGRF